MIRTLKKRIFKRNRTRNQNWSVSSLEPRLMLAADAGAQVTAELSTTVAEVRATSQTIIFVDQSLDDVDTLLTGVADPSAEIILLSPDADGIAQISRFLASRSEVQSIHLVTHGSDGVVQVGATQLDAQALRQRTEQIQAWRHSLATDADILLYGCNVAAGATGKAFVAELSRLTQADVASSDDVTGSSLSGIPGGADWDLEHIVGEVEPALVFRETPLQRYQGLLNSTVRSQTIEIYAAGQTGEENLDIFIDQNYVTTFYNVGGEVGQRQFERFVYEADSPVAADQVSVAFGNDEYDPSTGYDRNLVVDKMVLGGISFETEDPSTFSTGIWRDGLTGPGNYETETLNINSIFTYSSDGGSQPAGQVSVNARGDTGDEVLQIRVDGNVLGEFNVGTELNTYNVAVDDGITADRVQVAFVNDLYDPDNDIDRNLIVLSYDVNGETLNPVVDNVFSTGTYLEADGISNGFGRGNTLNSNGYFQASVEEPTSLGTQIRFDAKGTTASQVVRVTTRTGELIGEVEVDEGLPVRYGPVFRQFVVSTDRDISLEDIRLEFTNDGFDEFGQDRNVQIGGVLVENLDTGRIQRTSALDSQTFSTGVYLAEDGVQPGFGRGDTLFANGYFEFQESSRVELNLFGETGTEQYDVFIRGEKRATFSADEVQVLDLDEVVDDKDVRIEFINAGQDGQGTQRSLRVGSIGLDGRIHRAIPGAVETTGQFNNVRSLSLTENGFVQFGFGDPSGLFLSIPNNLGSTGSTPASKGFFTAEIQRANELDSTLTLQWTATSTFNDFPLAQESGIIVMREDQQRVTFNIPFSDTNSTGNFRVELISLPPGAEYISPPIFVNVI